MGSEYDRKFEEMKKYIPFLESMIKRLESNNSSSSNPRQAQLDKIRSLRDLLLDKKKRMKMDNLLKCEQVLVNLYAKVEQKDTLPVVKVENIDSSKDESDLEAVRVKLKTVAKIQNIADTLPEIARASEREEICEPGSKEPALFQRRPKSSLSPMKASPKKAPETKISPKSQSRRSYTRVLVSPEPRSSRWVDEEPSTEKQLFSRRSPRRSPRRNTPPYHKKERKKPSKSKEKKSRKDLNITLKVPEESLHSLNTDDILSRIINCSDGDVNIDTLRELRSQILGELKQTGTNDDISELILKSYSKKPKSKKKRKPEVEEGEISDSESEVIENVYGSLVVMDKDKKSGQVKTAAEKSNQQRKIQICLVINSDKEGENKPVTEIDQSESGMFENKSKDVICIDSDISPDKNIDKLGRKQSQAHHDLNENDVDKAMPTEKNDTKSSHVANTGGNDTAMTSDSPTKSENSPNKNLTTPTKIPYSPSQGLLSPTPSPAKLQDAVSEATKNIANFYKTHNEKAQSRIQSSKTSDQNQQPDNIVNCTALIVPTKEQNSVAKNTDDSTEIPLLNEPTLPPIAKKDVLSEIDILQALKNEILSETISIASETDTPALHQPKISKVALASDTVSAVHSTTITYTDRSKAMPKKRISIENYKKKSYKSLFLKKRNNAKRKEMKKQSLKLTEKECERFNFPTRLSLDDDTDEISDDDLLDDDRDWSVDDIYGDLAPKSPDVDFTEDPDIAPVVIPIEPVKTADFTSKTDIDLRPMSIPPQPVPPPAGPTTAVLPGLGINNLNSPQVFETNKKVPDGNRPALVDPRLRRDQPASKDSPNPYGAINLEGTPRPTLFPNIPPLLGPIYTPSYAPSMTPIRTPSVRTYDMTPSHPSFENEEPQQKHVYAPSFSLCDNRDLPVAKDRHVWEQNSPSNSNDDPRSRKDNKNTHWEYSKGSSAQRDPQPNYNPRNDKFYVDRRDGYNKPDCPTTPGPSFGWSDSPCTPRSSFGLLETPRTPSHPFGRSDCPTTPMPSFGRSDCPTTPLPSFGRSDCPTTPLPSFGRSDCPSTPIPSFGRSDCPPTPSHSFGGSECPLTPSHPFGRSECPATPNHPFGRSENKDPRLSRRQSDYEPRNQHDERDHGYHNDRSFNRSNSYKSHTRPYSGSDSPRNYDREQHFGRSDRYHSEQGSRYLKSNVSDQPQRFERERSIGRAAKSYPNELSDRSYDRARRDHSINRALPREDSNRLFTRNRDTRFENRYSDHNEEEVGFRNQNEGIVGRAMPMNPNRGRAPSVSKSEYNNSLSVKPKAGRSFTIDTSVNATFQNLMESGKGIEVFDYTFDSRRQRAASVGRSLVREISSDRILSHEDKTNIKDSTDFTSLRRRENFQRASSVGRTLVSNIKEKSFQEIKADFESYRLSTSKNCTKVETLRGSKKDILEVNKTKTSDSNPRSRKDDFEKHGRSSNAKQPYSPRKNYRDPRMRMDQNDKRRNKNDRGSSNSWERRHSGISYSNDNIAKGTIMGTGFGVKNYKIPKIKRPEPERPNTPIEELIKEHDKVKISTPKINTGKKIKTNDKKDKNKNSDDEQSEKNKTTTSKVQGGKKNTAVKSIEKKDKGNSDDGLKSKNKQIKLKDCKKAVISDDESEKRVTRSSKKNDSSLGQESIKKSKHIRKAIIDDSETNDEPDFTDKTKSKSKPLSNEMEIPIKQKVGETSTNTKGIEAFEKSTKSILSVHQKVDEQSEKSSAEKEPRKTLEEDSLHSSFCIDDLEMFSDNIVSDPVIDNINELIADLDHDLSVAKSTNNSFTTEMDKNIGAIDSQEENTLGDISDFIEKDLNDSCERLKLNLTHSNNDDQNTATPIVSDIVGREQKPDPLNSIEFTSKKSDLKVPLDKLFYENDTNSLTASTDEIVSTTQIDHNNSIKDVGDICTEAKTVQKIDSNDQSAPDSTIVQNDDSVRQKIQESLPDSTMDLHSEVSSDVTSTLNDTEKSSKETAEPSQSRKEVSAIESFGSLLSILQDKSKIKEFLSMLGEQSGESNKIKKKLEKLSEIVSDEEDANDNQSIDTNKSIKKTLEGESHEVHSINLQRCPENDTESVQQNANDEIHETAETPDTDKRVKDVQPDDQNIFQIENNKAECSEVYVPEDSQVLKNDENPPSSTQASHDKIDDGHDLKDQTTDDLNGGLGSNEIQDENIKEKIGKPIPKKTKLIKRGKGKYKRSRANLKRINKIKESKLQELKPKTPKKATNRELQKLQNDIKEMFMCDDVLNATGIRMCRLAKMVDKKGKNVPLKENEPVVLLKKYKSTESLEELVKKPRKKPGPKPKSKITDDQGGKYTENKIDKPKPITGYKPGPKSRTKQKIDISDPYEFDTDSVADTNTTKESDADSSDSESESLVSSASFGSSEVLEDIKKKPKKKRGSWKTGVIKSKYKKKKEQHQKPSSTPEVPKLQMPLQSVKIPDWNCFTDKTYCFRRGVHTYDCRLCEYSGTEIVNHYKKQHAHTEVPLSRMDPGTAKKAIQQCEEINIQAISKIPSEKYTCRFCYKEFSKTKVALETFFWHVVSTHTGEYKQLCYQCVNVTPCPFNLDIPPPPKDVKGQLIGYICGKCNYTQISLENLKTHVIVRHNDEQTEVYTINLGSMSQKSMNAMLRKNLTEDKSPRTLRSSRSNQSAVELSDDRSEISGSDLMSEASSAVPKIEQPDPHIDTALAEFKRTLKPGPMKSKIRFETDDQDRSDETSVKLETEHEAEYPHGPLLLDDTYHETHSETSEFNQTDDTVHLETNNESTLEITTAESDNTLNTDMSLNQGQVLETTDTGKIHEPRRSTDVFEKPHFKLNYKVTGAKEYVCCINGEDNHYKSTLLISLKKHVQTKHSEHWDGYCFMCKVIVTLQGVQSSFKDCLTHFLDRHLDNFPVMEKALENINEDSRSSLRSSMDTSTVERTDSPRSYIAVRPLSDLISKDVDGDLVGEDSETPFPIIENVVSLGNKTVEVSQSSPVYPTTSKRQVSKPEKPFQYEEVQADVMSKKHRIVLDNMMTKELLVRIFKCAGRYCSFTSDSAEDSLVHASAHKQLGGEGALDCAYCNFDAAGNAIDLVMHVFNEHGRCQYSCGQCFYRAAADQLVCAHITKAHEAIIKSSTVLRSTTFPSSIAADSSNLLSRESAVPYYICKNGEGSCKFRTYTPGKFCEHMLQKHELETLQCYICEVTKSTPSELVRHMKKHGLRLYQCTWCVHGSDSELELLSHVASLHPTKSPQGYLRIITNKGGSPEFRVLPLIYLNKTKKYSIEDITPSKIKENPTREAERSIELEKLIRHTNLMIETESDNLTSEPMPETPKETEAPNEIAESSDLTDEQTSQAIEKSLLSSPQKPLQVVNEPATPVKEELEEARSINQRLDSVVYCLDSEEEKEEPQKKVTPARKAKQPVIDLSDDESAAEPGREPSVLQQLVSEPVTKKPTNQDKPKFKKLTPDILFKCPNCERIIRNVASFKKHTNTCCLEMSTIRCPHAPCPIVLTNITQVINHYNKDHNVLNITKHYYCGICQSRWSTLNVTKKHLKDSHGVIKVIVTSKFEDDGTCTFTIHKEERVVAGPMKRKASTETLKKFGIDDIDKLPINPIMESLVYCSICEFSTKVRLNMVRHLQLHAERQPVPQTAPVNPVPHLESNEKHFDKMVNLASSSAATRDKLSTVAPEAASRFPKFVPDRQRHTCGAKGCSYISVDEGMLRCHWETLHSAAVDYHCAHCPPHQHLDTSKLLTASRIIAHLKMHDVSLYACSSCTYYHFKKQIVEKHIVDVHKEKGQVLIVREEGNNPSATPAAVGTMDLKSWQCGLCQFKSMLRRDLIEHCSKHHQTKMQYKCAYCPFRTSDIENIVKHQSNSHPTKAEDVFYYYYREGDVPNDADGTPRWQRQRQKCGIQNTEVKTEPPGDTSVETFETPSTPIDLNLVKKEIDCTEAEMSVEELCKIYGKFCDPNGIGYKCSLCKTVMEFTREAMQSHLYEELKYRRWSCAICSYKAYHRAGLNEHMSSEHGNNYIEPSKLPVNVNIEKWVAKLLDHQTAIIDANKVIVQQKMAIEKPVSGSSKGPSVVVAEPPKAVQSSDPELEQAFGYFGNPKDDSYCCPKCRMSIKDEDEMRNHLESELTRIRWCCTKCTDKFQTFHEAQFHCKSHPGLLSRPKEAIRDPSMRSAWVSAVIQNQKKSMKPSSQYVLEHTDSDPSENSLLVARYEEAVPTEEQLREIAREDQIREQTRKRPASSDSEDDENMVIYEPESKRINDRNCPYCDFVSKSNHQVKLCMREHILRHYNLKILTCNYCPFNSSRKLMYVHLTNEHPGMPQLYKQTEIPDVLPSVYDLQSKKKTDEDVPKKVCLHCEASVPENSLMTHVHGSKPSEFANKGDVVVKCCICLTLKMNLESMKVHYEGAHPDIANLNYAYYKLQIDTREVQSCGICNRRFTFLRDLRIHHSAMHRTFNLSYKTVPYQPEEDDHETRGKRKLEDVNPPNAKRIAKKSTSKLPCSKLVAKKSTTKLPIVYLDSDSEDEFSFYGTKPSSFNQYENVKTMMPMCNTVVEIDVKKLSGILKIDPKVVVKDINYKPSDT